MPSLLPDPFAALASLLRSGRAALGASVLSAALALCMVGGIAAPAHAATAVRVTGQLVDAAGEPSAGVSVTAQSTGGTYSNGTVTTDTSGRFSVPAYTGSVRLTFRIPYYHYSGDKITVTTSAVDVQDFRDLGTIRLPEMVSKTVRAVDVNGVPGRPTLRVYSSGPWAATGQPMSPDLTVGPMSISVTYAFGDESGSRILLPRVAQDAIDSGDAPGGLPAGTVELYDHQTDLRHSKSTTTATIAGDVHTVAFDNVEILPPPPPASVSAFRGDESARIRWRHEGHDNGSSLTTWLVTAHPTGQTFTIRDEVAQIDPDQVEREAVFPGLENGTTYTFTVSAQSAAGTSSPSPASNAVIPAGVPLPPADVVATGSESTVQVDWSPADPNGSPVTGYTVTVLPGPYQKSVTADQTSAILTGLRNGVTYTATVRATNVAGTSAPSSESNPVSLVGRPSAPTDVTATAGDAAATVSWTPAYAGGSPVTSYTVTSSPGGVTTTVAGDATNAEVAGLTNGTAYTFTVTASNAIGESPVSTPTASVTPKGAPITPAAPQVERGDGSVFVSWAAPSDNGSPITSYTVTRSPGGVSKTLSGWARGIHFEGLSNGTGYTFTVTATNAIGDSAASAPSAEVVPAGVPRTPGDVTATRGDRSAYVSWTPADDNGSPITSYTITSYPYGTTTTVPGDVTTAEVTGLANGTGYVFTVTATNAVGDSPASAPSDEVTPEGAEVAFARPTLSVREDSGTVPLVVMRGGDTTIPATVRYQRTGGTAGEDDVDLPAGKLTFAPGETTKTVALAVVGDALSETGETVVVTLDSPTGSPELAAPSAMTVTIAASDQRPDAWISTARSSGYVGDDVFNKTGYRQTKTVKARRTVTKTFHARVYNDGTGRNTVRIKGSAARAGSTVRYYAGSTDITRMLRSASGMNVTLRRGTFKLVTMRVTVLRSAAVGSLKPAVLSSTWSGDGTRTDAVRAVVKVTR